MWNVARRLGPLEEEGIKKSHVRGTTVRTRSHTQQLLLHPLNQSLDRLGRTPPEHETMPRIHEPGLHRLVRQSQEDGVDGDSFEVLGEHLGFLLRVARCSVRCVFGLDLRLFECKATISVCSLGLVGWVVSIGMDGVHTASSPHASINAS